MDTKAYLSVDIGSQHTRAWLFDSRSGRYDLHCSATAQTSIACGADIQTGVLAALDQIQKTSGYRLLDHQQKLILGKSTNGEGVERVGFSLSAGKPIRTALVAVSDTYSMAALRRLVNFFYTEVVLEINLQSDLNATAQLEKMMSTDVDLFVIAGGIDEGASKPVKAAIDNVRIVYQSLPKVLKPQIVFTGNQDLAEYAAKEFDFGEDFHLAGNIQPGIGREFLPVAWRAMLSAFRHIRNQQILGLAELQEQFGAKVIPTAFAMGRIVRLLDKINPSGKGVLALDVGSGSTTLIAAQGDRFIGTISHAPISEDIGQATCRFSSQPIDAETAAIYMYNKKLHPSFLPATLEDLAIEHAWTRVRLLHALKFTLDLYPDFAYDPNIGLLEHYEPVILSGESLVRVPALQHALLMALDGLQPHGITTFALDGNHIMAGLGTLGEIEPMVAVQMIDSGIFQNLGTVICVDSPEKTGKQVLSMEVDRDEQPRDLYQVCKSELKRIDVQSHKRTRIYLSPNAESDVGMGLPGLGGWVTVADSDVGVIIDARGRPLELPEDKNLRSEVIYNWLWELGG